MKNWIKVMAFALAVMCIFNNSYVYAAEANQMVTISVKAGDNSGGILMYALDSDAPEDFGYESKFQVPAGTVHTIYVKDEAGNISSQQYTASTIVSSQQKENDKQIDINMVLDGNGTNSAGTKNDYLTDSPAESGGGTLYSKTETNKNNNSDGKIFYTVTTKNDNVFYLVIDQSQSTDNVYLLDKVTESDLLSLVDGADAKKEKKEDSLLQAIQKEESSELEETIIQDGGNKTEGTIDRTPALFSLIFIGIVGGVYYYLKIYKKKKDEQMDAMDAMDMDEFEGDTDDDQYVDFEMDDREKAEYLSRVLAQDDIYEEEESDTHLLDVEPEEYAASHIPSGDDFIEDEVGMEFDPELDGEEEDE